MRADFLQTFAVMSYTILAFHAIDYLNPIRAWTPESQLAPMTATSPWTNHFMNLLLPCHCVLCGLRGSAGNLCASCKAALPRLRLACALCGLPLETRVARLCGECIRAPPPWDDATAALVYRFPVNYLVKQFKFHRKLACGQILADEMIDTISRSDAILPEALISSAVAPHS